MLLGFADNIGSGINLSVSQKRADTDLKRA
jgi:hypothetical protein